MTDETAAVPLGELQIWLEGTADPERLKAALDAWWAAWEAMTDEERADLAVRYVQSYRLSAELG